jgi:hypothetical protein
MRQPCMSCLGPPLPKTFLWPLPAHREVGFLSLRLLVWGPQRPPALDPSARVELVSPDTPATVVASRAHGFQAEAICILPEALRPSALHALRQHTSLPFWLAVPSLPPWVDPSLEPVRVWLPGDVGATIPPRPHGAPMVALFSPTGCPALLPLAVALARAYRRRWGGALLLDLNLHAPGLCLELGLWTFQGPWPALEPYLEDPQRPPIPLPAEPGLALVPGLVDPTSLDDVNPQVIERLLHQWPDVPRVVVTEPVVEGAATLPAWCAATKVVLVASEDIASRFHARRYSRLLAAVPGMWDKTALVLDRSQGRTPRLAATAWSEELGLVPSAWVTTGRPHRPPEASPDQAAHALVEAWEAASQGALANSLAGRKP